MRTFGPVVLIVLFLLATSYMRVSSIAMYPDLEGAWEPEYIGTRIEIKGDHLTILYRNRIVLDTNFALLTDGEVKILRLANNRLSYRDDKDDYAVIDKLYLENNQLHFETTYNIIGKDEEILNKTEASRYGDVEIVDDKFLPKLQGKWKAPNANFILEIKGNVMICRYSDGSEMDRNEITVIHNNDESDPNYCHIIHKDPAVMEGVGIFTRFTYENGKLITYEIIFDADSPCLEFEKIDE